ncbi:MAG: hypothetical protein Q7S40_33565 [Opitutaceae bacterium]|nr:hypothetical protein [Opitutaceae bacterium]
MKTQSLVSLCTVMLLSFAAAPAAEPAQTAEARVGVYDSRVVSFAHFWSEPARTERDALIASAKAAKAAGEQVRLKELEQQIVATQKRSHLQVFSTAPADEAMAALKGKLPALQQELGVTRLVSKWDEAALKGIDEANRVDATDRLAREFAPDAKRLQTIEQMKKAKPLPLDEGEPKGSTR